MFLEKFRFHKQLVGMGADVGMGGLDRFFHDVTQLTGQGQARLSLHQGGFDMQDLATHRCPGQTIDHTDLVVVQILLAQVFRRPQESMQPLGSHLDAFLRTFRHLAGHLATDRTDIAFQVAQAGFTGVLGNNLADDVIVKTDMLVLQPVFLDLARHQIALGDLQLLLLGVAGQADNLHTVAQGRRHRVDLVGRGDEHDVGEVIGLVDVMVGE